MEAAYFQGNREPCSSLFSFYSLSFASIGLLSIASFQLLCFQTTFFQLLSFQALSFQFLSLSAPPSFPFPFLDSFLLSFLPFSFPCFLKPHTPHREFMVYPPKVRGLRVQSENTKRTPSCLPHAAQEAPTYWTLWRTEEGKKPSAVVVIEARFYIYLELEHCSTR